MKAKESDAIAGATRCEVCTQCEMWLTSSHWIYLACEQIGRISICMYTTLTVTQPLLVLVGSIGVCSSRFDPEFPRIPSVGYYAVARLASVRSNPRTSGRTPASASHFYKSLFRGDTSTHLRSSTFWCNQGEDSYKPCLFFVDEVDGPVFQCELVCSSPWRKSFVVDIPLNSSLQD